MILWLSVFFEIRLMIVNRSGQIEDGFLRMYCPKRDKLRQSGQTYSSKPTQYIKAYRNTPLDTVQPH